MSDLVDGLTLGFQVFSWIVGLFFMAYWFRAMGNFNRSVMASLNPTFNRNPPSGKVALRRLWCSHRHVSRVRNSWGLQYTACTSCGKDVNLGKRVALREGLRRKPLVRNHSGTYRKRLMRARRLGHLSLRRRRCYP